jgi:hypothetical protein
MAVAANGPPRYRPASKVDAAMRDARTCYDHLAGRLGVGLADALRARGHVVLGEDGGEVTDAGAAFLGTFGVDLDAVTRDQPRRALLRACVDWSEQRHHLAGALGAALCATAFERGWVRRRVSVGRAVELTDAGGGALGPLLESSYDGPDAAPR